jgi:hypothetical protein
MSGAQGRFTSADEPLVDQYAGDPQSWNLYGYVRNNPLSFIDPTGRKCRKTDGGTMADDETGGGCEAAGVDPSGRIKSQKVEVQAIAPPSPELLVLALGMRRAQGPVNALAGATLGFVAAAWGVTTGGAVLNAVSPAFPEAAAFIPRALMTFANKQAARAAVAGLGLTEPQAQEALRTINRATATSTVQIIRSGQQVIVSIKRMGRDGFQQVEKFIDQSGGVRIVQKGINAAGDLTHYDVKR